MHWICAKCGQVRRKKEYEFCSQVSSISLVTVQSLMMKGDGSKAKQLSAAFSLSVLPRATNEGRK